MHITAKTTGCFNLLSGYPGCRQAEETVVLLWKLNGESHYLVVMFMAIVSHKHHYLVVKFVAIVSHERHYIPGTEVCGNCQSLPGS